MFINRARSWRYFTAICVTVTRNASRVFPNVCRSCWLSFTCVIIMRNEGKTWIELREFRTLISGSCRSGRAPFNIHFGCGAAPESQNESRSVARLSLVVGPDASISLLRLACVLLRYHLDGICLHWRDDGKCAFWGPTGDPTSLNCCRSCRRRRRRRLIGSTCRLNFYTIVFLFSFHFFIVYHPFVFLSSYIMSEANRGIVAGARPLAPAVPIAIAKCRDANARIVTKYRI